MKVIEHLQQARQPLISFEIVPPPRGRSAKEVLDAVESLAELNPSWIDVTSHKSTIEYVENADGSIHKKTIRKRPGTLGLCGIIQNRFHIDTVAHLLCLGFSREETEDALIELNYLGVHNILALRGDSPDHPLVSSKKSTRNEYADSLVKQIKDLSLGHFIDELEQASALDFGIGVAGYPEKHFEAPCLKTDVENIKRKVDAGADYVVTQMFFDNNQYFEFVKKCREAGITVPIVPGIKILQSVKQLTNLPKNFYIDLPEELVEQVQKNPERVQQIGQDWALSQMQGLLDGGAPSLHLYVLNNVKATVDVVKRLKR